MTVRIKKVTKYSKYFLFLAIASVASWVSFERSVGTLVGVPHGGTVPVVNADVPSSSGGGSSSDSDGGGGGGGGSDGADCDSGGDCE